MNPFSNLTDEKLMKLYQSGDEMAFEVLYQRHQNRVYTFLKKRLFEDSSVNDVFQNIFIKFHKSKKNYDEQYPLIKWIYTISRSELLDYLKKRRVTPEELREETLSFAELPEISDIDINIDEEKKLSDNEKKALKLRYFSEQEFDEISKELHISPSNARKLISRGLQKLRFKYAGGNK